MTKKILFSLEQCTKCIQTKQLLKHRDDVAIFTFPHDVQEWSPEDRSTAKTYEVIEDLQKTAPVLWVEGEKYLGYLRIRKWLNDHPQD